MPRPPKRINPQAHKTPNHSTEDGRAFRKGRFAATAGEPAVGREGTATLDAAFTIPQPPPVSGGARQPGSGRGSKYDARPATAGAPVRDARSPKDVAVHLTDDEERAGLVVIDLTKLPPVDPDSGSDTFYVRHSDGWPTSTE